jgi:hypothetical protein
MTALAISFEQLATLCVLIWLLMGLLGVYMASIGDFELDRSETWLVVVSVLAGPMMTVIGLTIVCMYYKKGR